MSELFAELAKPHQRVYYNRKWVRLEQLDALDNINPINIYILAVLRKSIFPLGIFVAHIDRRECILFRPDEKPFLMDLAFGLELLRGRLTLGLALKGGSMYIIQYGKHKSYKTSLQAVI